MKKTICPGCGSDNTELYFRIENMPLILSASPETLPHQNEIHPFEATLCKDCLLGFNSTPPEDSKLKFVYDNYLYISPLSGIGQSKYEGMLAEITGLADSDSKIIEIGCSEGYILHRLRERGFSNLTGVEPGPQAQKAKNELGLDIIQGYYTGSLFPSESVDSFILMHVFEHFNNPVAILKNMRHQLSPQGLIFIEIPNFDGYHHQHLFFYNTHCIRNLASQAKLKVIHEEIDNEYAALRVVLARNDAPMPSSSPTEEKQATLEKAARMQRDFDATVENLRKFLKNAGNVAWWGAGSTSVAYLNQIDQTVLPSLSIYDGDPQKIGMTIPGVGLKVENCLDLTGKTLGSLVIASSFHAEIRERLKELDTDVQRFHILE